MTLRPPLGSPDPDTEGQEGPSQGGVPAKLDRRRQPVGEGRQGLRRGDTGDSADPGRDPEVWARQVRLSSSARRFRCTTRTAIPRGRFRESEVTHNLSTRAPARAAKFGH